ANMIQVQFLRLNNAPMGAALAVIAMVSVSMIALVFVWLNRRFLRVKQ
ncbi:MAG: ABC transporter permease, partial [Pseudomonadota bacterium]